MSASPETRASSPGLPLAAPGEDIDDKTVGRHYAGPTWEHRDGSAVTGKAVGNAPGATVNDIPWLKLDVVNRRGSGTLADVTTVQRINSHGGAAQGACDQAGAPRRFHG